MKYTLACLLVAALLPCHQVGFAQEKAFEFAEKELSPRQIQLLGAESNDLVIHYIQHNKATGYDAKIYKSYLIFLSNESFKQRKVALPYSLSVKGLGYNKDFYFLLASKRDGFLEVPDAKYTIYKVSRADKSVMGMMDLDTGNESNIVGFSEEGVNYTVSMVKKPSAIRVRRIREFNVEVLDFAVNKEDALSLGSDALYTPPTQSDINPSSPNQRVFIRNGKLMILSRSPLMISKRMALSLYELDLAKPGQANIRPIAPPGTRGKLGFYALGDRLFLFEANESLSKVDIIDLNTLQILKSFSGDDPKGPLMKGTLCVSGAWGRLNEVPVDNVADEDRLEKITHNKPWILAWPIDDRHVKVSFGSHNSATGYAPQYTYMNFFLEPTSLEISTDTPALSRRQLILDKLFGEKKVKPDNIATYYTKETTFVLEFDGDASAFYVWK